MDDEIEINIGHKCTCSFTLSLRTIVEMGLKPTLQNTANTIAASLTSVELFKSYEVDHLFLLGNPFTLSYSSQMYIAYTILLQDIIRLVIESKGKDTPGLVTRETFAELLQSTAYDKSYVRNKFDVGSLGQVLKDTYAVRLKDYFGNAYVPFYGTSNCHREVVPNDGSFLVIFRKGQTIPMTGLTVKIKLGHLLRRYSTMVAGNFY